MDRDIPPYICDINDGYILLRGDCDSIASELNNLKAFKDNIDRFKIPFDNSTSDLASNKDFIEKFLTLLDLGVCLGRDFKLTYDPAFTARYLIDHGVSIKSYETISFDGHGNYNIEAYGS
jgi:hypothetical protein